MFKNLLDYKELLKSNIKKEIRGKYKGSFLGVLWSFINPLLTTLVYAIVFPFILKTTQDHYVTYLVIGILPWNYFVTSINQGTTTVWLNGGIIKKVYFPREVLPISIIGSNLVNFLISCIIIFIFLLFSGIGFSFYIFLLPLIILVQTLFQLAIVFVTSAIEVYVRDAEYIINFILNMMFYATPILYSADLFPKRFAWILNLNPMAIIINAYRSILYNKTMPQINMVVILLIISLILVYLGYKIFKKIERGFAEEL